MTEHAQPTPPAAWLDTIPLLAMALDKEDRVVWLSRALCDTLRLTGEQHLGQDARQAPPLSQLLADENEVVHLVPSVSSGLWLHTQITQTAAADGNPVTLYCYQDISAQMLLEQENARLRQEIDTLRLTDAVTGLPNQRALSQALERQVSLSRRYQNPLSIALFRVKPEVCQDEQQFRTMAHYLRDRLRWVDQIGMWGEGGFLAILPETSEEDARRLASAIVDEHLQGADLGLVQGTAAWNKGDGPKQLLRRAEDAIHQPSAASAD